MVSTSGSSGTLSRIQDQRGPAARRTAEGGCPYATTESGLLLHRLIRYAREYTPGSADLPRFPVYPAAAAARQVCATLGRASVCSRAIFQVEFALSRGNSRGRTAVIVGAQWGDEGK